MSRTATDWLGRRQLPDSQSIALYTRIWTIASARGHAYPTGRTEARAPRYRLMQRGRVYAPERVPGRGHDSRWPPVARTASYGGGRRLARCVAEQKRRSRCSRSAHSVEPSRRIFRCDHLSFECRLRAIRRRQVEQHRALALRCDQKAVIAFRLSYALLHGRAGMRSDSPRPRAFFLRFDLLRAPRDL